MMIDESSDPSPSPADENDFCDSLSSEDDEATEEERHLNERHSSLVIGREVNIETDEGTHDHSTMKLKGVENVSNTKKRRKNNDASSSMKDKDQAESSKEAKAPSEPSKTDKAVDAEESIQDDVVDAKESIQDDDAPTQGPLGHKTILVDLFFNKDLEYLKTRNKEKKYAISLTKLKAARYELEGLEEMIPKL
ncbi:hypothetical protein Tco_0935861 [Tanacetum coccineum]